MNNIISDIEIQSISILINFINLQICYKVPFLIIFLTL